MLRAFPIAGCVVALACSACGGNDDGGSSGADAASDDDGGSADCDPAAVLPDGWRAVDALASGTVDSTADGDAVASIIDASAGGFGNSDGEAFLYLSFGDATLDAVALTDVEAFDDTGWDIAFKRYVIRTNGGDSGTGGVSVAEVSAATLEDVAAAPADGEFDVDRWTDASCLLVGDGIGGPLTQLSGWYDIADMILTPKPLVYVVRRPDGGDVAFEIEDYYADADAPEESGVYRVRWAPLE
jgi:hypothetical protein